jgi:hypothetical protein
MVSIITSSHDDRHWQQKSTPPEFGEVLLFDFLPLSVIRKIM